MVEKIEEEERPTLPQYASYSDERPCCKLEPHPINPDMLMDVKNGVVFFMVSQKDYFTGSEVKLVQLNHPAGFVIEEPREEE